MRDLGRLLLYGGALQSAGPGVEELLVGERAAGKKEKQICVQPESLFTNLDSRLFFS